MKVAPFGQTKALSSVYVMFTALTRSVRGFRGPGKGKMHSRLPAASRYAAGTDATRKREKLFFANHDFSGKSPFKADGKRVHLHHAMTCVPTCSLFQPSSPSMPLSYKNGGSPHENAVREKPVFPAGKTAGIGQSGIETAAGRKKRHCGRRVHAG